MDPSLEPVLYVAALALFIAFLALFPKRRLHLPHVIPSPVFLYLGIAVFLVEYLVFTTPAMQKQLADFGLLSVRITPWSLILTIGTLAILSFVRIPKWVVAIAIVPLTFYVGQMAYYDATHFIGPIHDLLLGKPPLSSPSWYGFLPIIGLSLVFRIIPLTLVNFYIVIASIETLGVMLLYVFALKLFQETRWATLTIALVILFHVLVQFGDRNFYPQSTFVRFGIWLPVAWALMSQTVRWHLISLVLAVFWTADTGMYILGAYMATALTNARAHWVRTLLPLVLYTSGAFLGISILFRIVWGAFPRWTNYWQFALGYTSIPTFALAIPPSVIPWIFLIIPIVMVCIRAASKPIVIQFLAWLTLFTFTYYSADSHFNALRAINIPVIFCLVWLTKHLARFGRAAQFFIVAAALLPTALWGQQAFINVQAGNILTTIQTIRHPPVTEYAVVGSTALEIKKRYQSVLNSGDFAVISAWDTYYLLIWNTTNKLGSNCLLCYWTQTMAKPLIDTAQEMTVQYLFVDRERAGYEGRVSWIFDPISVHFRFVEQIGDLDVYQRL